MSDANNALWRINKWYPELDPRVAKMAEAYHSELIKFNLKVNLISRNTEREADENHFADCLMGCQLIVNSGIEGPVFDIGSGNGLPGLILAIMAPKAEVHLVESDTRKGEFMKHVIHFLGLENAKVLNLRLESLKKAELNAATTRGFATITKTLLSCNASFLKGGRIFHFKGPSWSREVAEIPSQIISQWKPELLGEYSLPNTQVRRVVVCTTKI
ncbi:MAG: 16S rRNA (guanine(527)-N(7))-methyltransferase RsmG [Bdellovibrionales bacterium]